MANRVTRSARVRSTGGGPLSVVLPTDLRRRLQAQAKKRRLKVATAARLFLDEHVSELEDVTELSKAEEWQRAQAWATWDKIAGGDRREVPFERLEERAERALKRLAARRRTR